MTVAITGGSGFIGTRLARRLSDAGTPFTIVDKAPSRAYPALCTVVDVRDRDALTAALGGASAIVHLAAEHRDDVRPRSLYDDVNVRGAEHVVAAAEANGIETIVFTSSVAIYGFAAPDTDESGPIAPFNDYGRTKAAAEEVLRAWQARDAEGRTLIVIRPTVVFGEGNRGNVYNLLHQIAGGRFVMIGTGDNVKSMAYVENVAALLEAALTWEPGLHVYNYIDKPDMDTATLVRLARSELGRGDGLGPRLPYRVGYLLGLAADGVARLTRRRFPISAIRVRKFAATTQFATSIATTGFRPPVALEEALRRTIRHEFVEPTEPAQLFFSE